MSKHPDAEMPTSWKPVTFPVYKPEIYEPEIYKPQVYKPDVYQEDQDQFSGLPKDVVKMVRESERLANRIFHGEEVKEGHNPWAAFIGKVGELKRAVFSWRRREVLSHPEKHKKTLTRAFRNGLYELTSLSSKQTSDERIKSQVAIYTSSFAFGAVGPLINLVRINMPNTLRTIFEEHYWAKGGFEALATIADLGPLAIGIASASALRANLLAAATVFLGSTGVTDAMIDPVTNTLYLEAFLNTVMPSDFEYIKVMREIVEKDNRDKRDERKRKTVIGVMDEVISTEAKKHGRNKDKYTLTAGLIEELRERNLHIESLIGASEFSDDETDRGRLGKIQRDIESVLMSDAKWDGFDAKLAAKLKETAMKVSKKLYQRELEAHLEEREAANNLIYLLTEYQKCILREEPTRRWLS